MFRFSIFRIPVEVQPFFWVTTALLGGALYADSRQAFFAMVLFILAAFVSILIHELGHALSGRKLGGGQPVILLTAFGGLAINQGGRFTRWGRFWMIAAGPGAGFVFLIVIIASLAAVFGPGNSLAFVSQSLFGLTLDYQDAGLVTFLIEKPFVGYFIHQLLWINFWWGIINLLPVAPLDGGQIAALFIRPERRVYLVGMITGTAMGLFGFFWMGSLYTAVLFGYLAWQNYKNMKAVSWQ